MEASRVVVARYEYPYRIKRRLSDEVTEKGPLIALGHELQERQAASRLWVRSDSTWVADVYEAVLGKLDESFGDSCRDAWATAVDESGEVESLDGWGPGSPTKQLHTFEHAVSWRFGWRRFVPSLLCKRLVAAGADTH
jgi:hypothetical protein